MQEHSRQDLEKGLEKEQEVNFEKMYYKGTIIDTHPTENKEKTKQGWFVDVRINDNMYPNIFYNTALNTHTNPNIDDEVLVLFNGNKEIMRCVPIQAVIKNYDNRTGALIGNFKTDMIIEFTENEIKIGYIGKKPLKVQIDGENVEINGATQIKGDVSITGNLTVDGTSTAEDHISGGISGKEHTHIAPAGGGPTGTPN